MRSYLMQLSFLLTILSTMTVVRSDCNTCVSLQAFGCNVCYNSCDSNKMLTCEHTYCSEYVYDQNGTSTCSEYKTENLPETQCFHKCCQSEQSYFSVDELKRCQQKSKQRITIAIAVSCSIAGVILIIILACCGCCTKLTQCCQCLGGCFRDFCGLIGDCLQFICCCKCFRSSSAYPAPQNVANVHSFELTKADFQVKWENEGKSKQILQDETTICSICLNNRANTSGSCGHCFHVECIAEWFNRNPHCPICRSDQVRWVKFYCRGCCQRFIKFDLSVDKKIDEYLQQAKGPNCPICQ